MAVGETALKITEFRCRMTFANNADLSDGDDFPLERHVPSNSVHVHAKSDECVFYDRTKLSGHMDVNRIVCGSAGFHGFDPNSSRNHQCLKTYRANHRRPATVARRQIHPQAVNS